MAGYLNNISLNLEIVLKNKAKNEEISIGIVERLCEKLLVAREVSFAQADGTVEKFKLCDIEYEITNTEETH
ncbi:YopT family protein [Bacillus atrophaeus]|uniref:YopT family protein n=1 Tax=Bacillus atrophaeus TaxID=1452 RepID=UPI002E22751D|nr:YopT family protein [Bacillus atrophaeus]